jgi:hypothetical protein
MKSKPNAFLNVSFIVHSSNTGWIRKVAHGSKGHFFLSRISDRYTAEEVRAEDI